MIEGWTMSDSKINEMQESPFPENGEPIAVLVPR